jgi:hypothetical protein
VLTAQPRAETRRRRGGLRSDADRRREGRAVQRDGPGPGHQESRPGLPTTHRTLAPPARRRASSLPGSWTPEDPEARRWPHQRARPDSARCRMNRSGAGFDVASQCRDRVTHAAKITRSRVATRAACAAPTPLASLPARDTAAQRHCGRSRGAWTNRVETTSRSDSSLR